MPRPQGERRTSRLSISLDPQTYAELRALAQRSDVSAAWMIRRAVTELLEPASRPKQLICPYAGDPRRRGSTDEADLISEGCRRLLHARRYCYDAPKLGHS